MSALLALAARCEQASGPDRTLDAMIHARNGIAGTGYAADAPAYTASLDAAMSLVPEGWIWDVTSTGTAWAMPLGDGEQVFGKAATPALALTAASLRALSSRVKS